jgi:Cd2+/Zn2+-exporting ATPase
LLGAGSWSEWIGRALIFLVISCPCALVLSIPLTFFAGLAITSKHGVLFKGADALERLPKTKAVVLDKTGTLTEGEFAVQRIESAQLPEDELLALAAAAEQNSLHPVAVAIARADTRGYRAERVQEYAGKGVVAQIGARRVAVGNRALMEQEGVSTDAARAFGSRSTGATPGRFLSATACAKARRPPSRSSTGLSATRPSSPATRGKPRKRSGVSWA